MASMDTISALEPDDNLSSQRMDFSSSRLDIRLDSQNEDDSRNLNENHGGEQHGEREQEMGELNSDYFSNEAISCLLYTSDAADD